MNKKQYTSQLYHEQNNSFIPSTKTKVIVIKGISLRVLVAPS